MGKGIFERPIAHRGLHDKARGIIENSRSAFEAAIAGGFAIECDVQLTRDGVPVVFHDDRLDRLTGLPGFVRDTSSDVLLKSPLLGSPSGDCPQTFGQLLEQVAGRTLLQVELKHQTKDKTKPLAAVAVANVSHYAGPLCFQSFDPHLLIEARKAGYHGQLGIITEQYIASGEDYDWLKPFDRLVLRHLLHWPLTRFDFVSVDKDAVSVPAVRLFRALGKPVTAWTIRSAEQAKAALSGVDQIVFEGFIPQSA
jgi:glycerophosphoryl diester phosphodiesterase